MSKRDIVLSAIKQAMGRHVNYFEIMDDETLEDSEDIYSITVFFNPKKIEIEDGKVCSEGQTLIFQISDDEDPVLIIGEDTEQEITAANIYASLYWGEVVKAA